MAGRAGELLESDDGFESAEDPSVNLIEPVSTAMNDGNAAALGQSIQGLSQLLFFIGTLMITGAAPSAAPAGFSLGRLSHAVSDSQLLTAAPHRRQPSYCKQA
jgi:hypothetical protein